MDVFLDLFSTQGRANRAWYIWHIILDDLAIFTAVILLFVLGIATGSLLVVVPGIGVLVAGIWAAVCVTIKRLHDLDRPSWHWWLLMVPFYNLYLGFVLLFSKGTEGPNEFGRDPLAGARSLPGSP
ncbi:MAG: DUF805 domain-containing protein [Gemmatimonadetes bacterium]|nr:DUF805 domain-containing protein [Gemmatimonadota bacterium]MDA1103465.1 DUF805 domain-containing protein [Gemmatimonadota bacterium]